MAEQCMTPAERCRLRDRARDCFLQAAAALTAPRLPDAPALADAILFGALGLERLRRYDETEEGMKLALSAIEEVRRRRSP